MPQKKKTSAQLQREIKAALANPHSSHKLTMADRARHHHETMAKLDRKRVKKRSHATMKSDRLHEAQLYWDAQDPKNEGWWLRYRDERGVEQGTAIEAAEDATTEELAEAVEAETHWLPSNGKIKVFRGEQPRGSITLTDGKVSDWRAL